MSEEPESPVQQGVRSLAHDCWAGLGWAPFVWVGLVFASQWDWTQILAPRFDSKAVSLFLVSSLRLSPMIKNSRTLLLSRLSSSCLSSEPEAQAELLSSQSRLLHLQSWMVLYYATTNKMVRTTRIGRGGTKPLTDTTLFFS